MDPQDTAKFVPVLDIILVRPIQVVEFLLYCSVEVVARVLLLWVVFSPFVLLAQTIEFGNGRLPRLGSEPGILREENL
jgi:hypothetical protein